MLCQDTILCSGVHCNSTPDFASLNTYIEKYFYFLTSQIKAKSIFKPVLRSSNFQERHKKTKSFWHRSPQHYRSVAYHFTNNGSQNLLIVKGGDLYHPDSVDLTDEHLKFYLRQNILPGCYNFKSSLRSYLVTAFLQNIAIKNLKRPTHIPLPVDVVLFESVADLSTTIDIHSYLGQYYMHRNNPILIKNLKKYLLNSGLSKQQTHAIISNNDKTKGKAINQMVTGLSQQRYILPDTDLRLFDLQMLFKSLLSAKKKDQQPSAFDDYVDGLNKFETLKDLVQDLAKIYSLILDTPKRLKKTIAKTYLQALLDANFKNGNWQKLIKIFSKRLGEVAGLGHGLGMAFNNHSYHDFWSGSFGIQNIVLTGAVVDMDENQFAPNKKQKYKLQQQDLASALNGIVMMSYLLSAIPSRQNKVRVRYESCKDNEKTLRTLGLQEFFKSYAKLFLSTGVPTIGSKSKTLRELYKTISCFRLKKDAKNLFNQEKIDFKIPKKLKRFIIKEKPKQIQDDYKKTLDSITNTQPALIQSRQNPSHS